MSASTPDASGSGTSDPDPSAPVRQPEDAVRQHAEEPAEGDRSGASGADDPDVREHSEQAAEGD